jgi:phosphonate transport system ATP-binding protein
MTAIEFDKVEVTFPDGTRALKGVAFSVEEGEVVGVIGLSGAGKSTLLRTVNGLVTPTGGTVRVFGRDTVTCGERELRKLRSEIGMIFQHFNLVDRLTVLKNVLCGRLGRKGNLAALLQLFSEEEVEMALRALERVGIFDKAASRADQLSGGQQQRVGIARALVQEPRLMLADEPVASLDPETSRNILGHLMEIVREDGLTLLMNIHSVPLARDHSDRIVGLKDGLLVYDGPSGEFTDETYDRVYRDA